MKQSILALLTVVLISTAAVALQVGDQVKINEVYFAYPPEYTIYQDQFVELYNAGRTTCYLDGAMICRGIPDDLYSAWRFPRNVGGTTLPIEPGEFVLIARDAYDFTQENSASVNLSFADWESYYEYEDLPGDNPSVPNLIPAWDVCGDFTMTNQWGQILLATGEDLTTVPGSG